METDLHEKYVTVQFLISRLATDAESSPLLLPRSPLPIFVAQSVVSVIAMAIATGFRRVSAFSASVLAFPMVLSHYEFSVSCAFPLGVLRMSRVFET